MCDLKIQGIDHVRVVVNNFAAAKAFFADLGLEVKDIIIDGSATLVQSLQGTGLIDGYPFLVEPINMGSGRRFFAEGTAMTKLRLAESKMLQSGTLWP